MGWELTHHHSRGHGNDRSRRRRERQAEGRRPGGGCGRGTPCRIAVICGAAAKICIRGWERAFGHGFLKPIGLGLGHALLLHLVVQLDVSADRITCNRRRIIRVRAVLVDRRNALCVRISAV